MAIRAVIWDMGGVLVRTEDKAPRAALAQRFGMSYQDLEELIFSSDAGLRAQRGELSAKERWQYLPDEVPVQPEEIDAFHEAFFGGDRVDATLIDYIRALRPRYRTGILSNAFSDLRRVMTQVWRIDDVFDSLIISAEVRCMKPEARIYQLAVQDLGVAPQEAVFIDDSMRNIDGSRAAGLQAVHFQSPAQARAELDALLGSGV